MNWREERKLLASWLETHTVNTRRGMSEITERTKTNQRKKRRAASFSRWKKRHPKGYRNALRKRREASKAKHFNSPLLAKRREQHALIERYFLCPLTP